MNSKIEFYRIPDHREYDEYHKLKNGGVYKRRRQKNKIIIQSDLGNRAVNVNIFSNIFNINRFSLRDFLKNDKESVSSVKAPSGAMREQDGGQDPHSRQAGKLNKSNKKATNRNLNSMQDGSVPPAEGQTVASQADSAQDGGEDFLQSSLMDHDNDAIAKDIDINAVSDSPQASAINSNSEIEPEIYPTKVDEEYELGSEKPPAGIQGVEPHRRAPAP